MAVAESKRKGNDRYNAKCDAIILRPLKPAGERIRNAAKVSGKSLQGYILDAVDAQIAYDETGEHELDPNILPNIISWLKSKGHSPEEITDCLENMAKKG